MEIWELSQNTVACLSVFARSRGRQDGPPYLPTNFPACVCMERLEQSQGKEKKQAKPEACSQQGRHEDGRKKQASREHPFTSSTTMFIPLCLSFLSVKQDSNSTINQLTHKYYVSY